MNRESAFFHRSVKIAEKFLQTALVIDDRAFIADPQSEPVIAANLPSTPSTAEPVSEDAVARKIAEAPPRDQAATLEPHRFNPQPVIDGFARHGIICGVLNRVSDDTLENIGGRLNKLVDVADILVVDWHIHVGTEESTEETLTLLETILQRNVAETPRQLRLVAIYTGENNLQGVAEKIRERLESKFGALSRDGDFCMIKGAVRIVVLGKKTNKRTPEAQSQEVDFEELGARTIEEFTAMTAGLISNAALQSLSSLRSATHRILDRFSPSLDAAYLVHRSLLETPQEADEHLCPLIAAELQAVIEDSGTSISADTLSDWIDERQQRIATHADFGFGTVQEEKEFLLRLFDQGHAKLIKEPLPNPLEWIGAISPFRGCSQMDDLIKLINGTPSPESNEQLAMVMAVKTHYSSDPPKLTLGTVVSHEKDSVKTFWLCLQPVCDSVRIPGARGFPMLRLSQSNDRFGLVVKIDSAYVRLRVDPRPFKVRTVEFKADKNRQTVIATLDENGKYLFTSKGAEFQCQWIAELKFEQAQRAVNLFASQNSRVGLTESEWQRRWDGNG